MLRRWHVLLMIVVTLAAFCLLAAGKLRATPKYDRVQMGMTCEEVNAVFHQRRGLWMYAGGISCDEGDISISFSPDPAVWDPVAAFTTKESKVIGKSIERRGPAQRMAWIFGWLQ